MNYAVTPLMRINDVLDNLMFNIRDVSLQYIGRALSKREVKRYAKEITPLHRYYCLARQEKRKLLKEIEK
jgi:hypothetical protein